MLAFGEASAIRAGAALTLHQGFARLASVMYAADIVSIGSQWLLRWVAPGWSAENTRGKVKNFEIAGRVFSARNGGITASIT